MPNLSARRRAEPRRLLSGSPDQRPSPTSLVVLRHVRQARRARGKGVVMAPRSTTGIRLTQFHRTGRYALNRPGHDTTTFEPDVDFAGIATTSGLTNGYWLREHTETDRTTWTWIQL
ncbi:hypothetical protein I5J35_gp51 [Mycobacterium phage Rem711]|uniref:Uncharacterized protein n=1 Tax=Mycobacterium phage Rem711 TaxID=2079285 RepID=A0A2K9VF30_9CAUD|nr:hypothetical protein I5J35_gp51 [Mycobacterium phage Rem711]AUV60829.1 hypothetical protein SEA_REM711_51 [Mycobacterium phage Rem711]